MKEADFPALYLAANVAAINAQKHFLRTVWLQSSLLILGAILALLAIESAVLAIISGLVFLASLAVFIYAHNETLQSKWYQARALAESVKTATWRFVMCADPFSKNNADSTTRFRSLLKELLQQNSGIGNRLGGDVAAGEQITPAMLEVRNSPLGSKREIYLKHRVDDQQKWYAKKSEFNRSGSRFWFWMLCACYAAAIICAFIRVGWPNLTWMPVDVFAVAASTCLTWTQLKRFDEISSAYALTAHEIGSFRGQIPEIRSEQEFSGFVSDAENAFSREHTQWAARRDH